MSKHLKKKISPAPSSDDDDDSLTQDLPILGAVDLVTATRAGSTKALDKDVRTKRRVAEQIDSLRAVLLNLVTLVASSAAPGQLQGMLPSGDEQGSLRGVSEDPLVQGSAAIAASGRPSAITATAAATLHEDAILGGSAGVQLESAILTEPRGARPREPVSGVDSGTGRRLECFYLALRVRFSFHALDGGGDVGCLAYSSG
ncbi:unnamed protein product [Lampetra planeri]